MRTGIVLEGGALRGIFTAGVLDYLMENNLRTDYAVGVSAGGGNAMAYKSNQPGRTKNVILRPKEELFNKAGELIKTGNVLNLDKMYDTDPYSEDYFFDFDTYYKSDMEVEYVVTCCESGQAEYLSEDRYNKRLTDMVKASCSVPVLCRPVEVDGKHYLDGSIADSIPVVRAFEKGCDRVIVVLTKSSAGKPTNYTKYRTIIERMYKGYPAFICACFERVSMYEAQVDILNSFVNEGRVLVIQPEMEDMSKFESDKNIIMAHYNHGVEIAEREFQRIVRFLGK